MIGTIACIGAPQVDPVRANLGLSLGEPQGYAFEEIVRRPNEQEDVLRDMTVRCLSA